MAYRIIYLPTAEIVRYGNSNSRKAFFMTKEKALDWIATKDCILGTLPHYKKNSHIYRSDTVIPKYLLDVIQIGEDDNVENSLSSDS